MLRPSGLRAASSAQADGQVRQLPQAASGNGVPRMRLSGSSDPQAGGLHRTCVGTDRRDAAETICAGDPRNQPSLGPPRVDTDQQRPP
jgi:hypothetical protein